MYYRCCVYMYVKRYTWMYLHITKNESDAERCRVRLTTQNSKFRNLCHEPKGFSLNFKAQFSSYSWKQNLPVFFLVFRHRCLNKHRFLPRGFPHAFTKLSKPWTTATRSSGVGWVWTFHRKKPREIRELRWYEKIQRCWWFRNPVKSPVEGTVVEIPLFTGFYTPHLVQDFSSMKRYEKVWLK